MRILVVEDERKIAALLRKALAEAGYAVNELFRGDEALDALRETPYDAAVLDVMLPGLDGLAVLRRLRAESNPVPILLLTARGEISDKVEGLELGADDYLSKPFAVEELVARVRALLRRQSGELLTVYKVGDLSMDVARRRALRGGQRIELTAREFSLLELLLRSPGHVLLAHRSVKRCGNIISIPERTWWTFTCSACGENWMMISLRSSSTRFEESGTAFQITCHESALYPSQSCPGGRRSVFADCFALCGYLSMEILPRANRHLRREWSNASFYRTTRGSTR